MQKAGNDDLVYTVAEAARLAKISRNYLYGLIKKKGGPRVKRFGNRIRIPASALHAWINKT